MGTGDGYSLAVDASAVDASRVAELAAGAPPPGGGRRGDRAGAGAEGLALFRGEVLVDAGDWAAAAPDPAGGGAAGPGRGRHGRARRAGRRRRGRGRAESLVEQYPLREGLWASLITALYRAGRQADALAAYAAGAAAAGRRARHRAGRGAAVARAAGAAAEPGARARHVASGRSARQPARSRGDALVGRDDDLATLVTRCWSEHRLVTVVGLGRRGQDPARPRGRSTRWSPPGGVWLVRLDARRRRPPPWRRSWPRRCTSPAASRRSASGCPAPRPSCCWTTASTSSARWPRSSSRCSTPCPQLRILATSQVPLGLEDEHVHQLEPLTQDDSVALFARRAQEMRRQFVLDADDDRRGRGGLPLAGRAAAGDRARGGAGAVAVGARHRPAARRPVRPAARPEQPAPGATPGAGRRDRVELRAAVPRRPARALGAVLLRRQRLAGRDRARAGGAGRAGRVGARHDQPAGRPVAGQRRQRRGRCGALPAARQHPGLRRRAVARVRSGRRGRRRARRLVRRDGRVVRRSTCAATGSRSAWRSPEPSGPTSTPRWPGAPRTIRCSAYSIANGFGWTWVVLGDGTAGAARVRERPGRPRRRPATGRPGCCSPAGWRRRPATSDLAQADLDAAGELADELGDDGAGRGRRPAPGVPLHPAGSPRRGARQRARPAWRRTDRSDLRVARPPPACCSPPSAR